LTEAIATFSPPTDAPRAELARLCRQICLAREQGATAAGKSLDDDLSQALSSIRTTYGIESVHENDLLDLYRTEYTRVADASLLAELIAPKIAARLRAEGTFTDAPPSQSASPARPPTSPAAPRPLSASSTLPAAPAAPPGIADLLDGMLEQDREDERTRRTGSRR
jgi:hypothetical protein